MFGSRDVGREWMVVSRSLEEEEGHGSDGSGDMGARGRPNPAGLGRIPTELAATDPFPAVRMLGAAPAWRSGPAIMLL